MPVLTDRGTHRLTQSSDFEETTMACVYEDRNIQFREMIAALGRGIAAAQASMEE